MPLVHAGALAGAVSLAVEDGDMEAVAEVCPLPLADAGKVQAQDEGCEGSFGSYEVVLEDHRHVLEEVPLPDAVPHVGERDQIVFRQVSGLDCCLVLCELWRSGGEGGVSVYVLRVEREHWAMQGALAIHTFSETHSKTERAMGWGSLPHSKTRLEDTQTSFSCIPRRTIPSFVGKPECCEINSASMSVDSFMLISLGLYRARAALRSGLFLKLVHTGTSIKTSLASSSCLFLFLSLYLM